MKIDESAVDKLAELSKLQFDEGEKKALVKDLNKILDWIDKLDEVDTSEVEEMIYITDQVNNLRQDKAETRINKQEALLNAPIKDSDYIKVAKVITSKSDT